MMHLTDLAETGFIPDVLVRMGIRRLLARRRRAPATRDTGDPSSAVAAFARQLRASPLAVDTGKANEQHYEVPAEFFEYVLGPRLKYSCCWFETPQTELAEAEEQMLRLTAERAQIEDGMRVLDLGCGWGSLALWLAERFPGCEITAVSNSAGQRRFIESRARERHLENLRVITADMRDFDTTHRFDRIVSVEMFEHMRNYELLLRRVSNWLVTGGKALVHIFCHRDTPYLFETDGAANWMGRHFFTGGMMPSEDLLAQFDRDLSISTQWRVGGLHYWRTCEAWLKNLDANRNAILARFRRDVSRREAMRSLRRWRIFFMACAELFRYGGGSEWFVAHYLLEHRDSGASESTRASRRFEATAP